MFAAENSTAQDAAPQEALAEETADAERTASAAEAMAA